MKIFIIIVIILIVLILLIGNYLYNMALNPKASKKMVLGEKGPKTEEEIENEKWIIDNFKDSYIISKNNGNLKLHSYEINMEKENRPWVILVHGYTNKGIEMGRIAKKFYDRKYNILILDLRGHGKSEGTYIGMGWHDRLDIIDWIEYLNEKYSNPDIILFGISMGAASVMMTVGEDIPDNVKLAIEDCGYTSVWDEFESKLKTLFKLPSFPILNVANMICNIRAKYDIKEASSINQIKKSKTPILFIHGSEDKFVPFWMQEKLYNAATCKKEKLVIEGAKHGKSGIENPELYWKTIDEFIEKNI